MSDAPRGPRVVLEEEPARPAERLDFGWEQAVVPMAPTVAPKPAGWSGLGRLAGLLSAAA